MTTKKEAADANEKEFKLPKVPIHSPEQENFEKQYKHLPIEARFESAKALAQAAVNDLVTVGQLHASEYAQRRAREIQAQVNAL